MTAVDSNQSASAAVDLDQVLEGLRERVAQRRAEGAYPPGLEADLEADLARIITRPSALSTFTDMRALLEGGGPPPGVDPARVAHATASGMPGGAALHSAVARAVSHQVSGVLSQVQEISNALWAHLLTLADAITALKGSLDDKRALLVIVDALVERVAAYERVPAEPSLAVAELTRRIERLEVAEVARNPRPWFSADLLTGAAPGPAAAGPVVDLVFADTREDLVGELESCGPVLVLGRPELVTGLQRSGVDASGPGSATGLEAEVGPLLALESTPDRSLGALVVGGTLECLAPGEVLDLVRASFDKLRPGGRLVVRAANPRSLWGLAHGTAGRPDRTLVDPGWLELCVAQAGFGSAELVWGPPAPGGAAPTGEDTEGEAHRAIFLGPLYYTIRAIR